MNRKNQFLTSRAGSPAPFRPIRSNTLTDEDLEALETLAGSSKPKVDLASLTKQAESQ